MTEIRGHFLSSDCRASFNLAGIHFLIYVRDIFRGIFVIYRGIYPPSLLSAARGVTYIYIYIYIYIYQREGGDPERCNGNSLAAMDGTGPMGNAIVLLLLLLLLLFPRRGLSASPGGKRGAGPKEKNARG